MSPAALAALVACTSACSHAAHDAAGDPDATPTVDVPQSIDAAAVVDNDGDGLDDAYELKLATDYEPFVSLDPGDGCPLAGFAVRVRKHPADPTKIHIVYDHLFQDDCGLGGHVGDNEAFGIVIDPTRPAPAGILAIKTASHQGTVCERVTDCSTCANDTRPACERTAYLGAMWPVLYASKDKHGQYATKCSSFGTCFDTCTLAAAPQRPPIVNVGEPDHHLVSNLTTQGFITMGNGWSKAELMNFDPWAAGVEFGGAGDPAGDFVDDTFLPAPCN